MGVERLVPIAAKGIRLGLNALMSRGKETIKTALADPALVARAAARIGLSSSKATVSSLLRAAANNKMNMALILWELGDLGASDLSDLAAEDAEVYDLYTTLQAEEPDSVTASQNVNDISGLEDEFRALSIATVICGSWERFEQLRLALQVDASTRATYLTVKRMGRLI